MFVYVLNVEYGPLWFTSSYQPNLVIAFHKFDYLLLGCSLSLQSWLTQQTYASLAVSSNDGINLLELFEAAHFPEWMCRPLRVGGGSVNTVATALVLYKLVSPLRYGLTLVLARYTVHYLRAKGKAPQLTDQDRLRNLAREGARLSGERVRYKLSKSRKAAISFSKNAGRTLTTKGRR
ncbi:hypothetical protein CRM22_006996 [Opisthorchis felineus]|uniref:DUF1279 domain-containing protein n=1 Tax=Opisthorchis felineus TaxID=147828 RepID=A0A4V3SE56_OPIFE|nr:hypothetical protein CRM22_006996 [Opisthorchis felineus]